MCLVDCSRAARAGLCLQCINQNLTLPRGTGRGCCGEHNTDVVEGLRIAAGIASPCLPSSSSAPVVRMHNIAGAAPALAPGALHTVAPDQPSSTLSSPLWSTLATNLQAEAQCQRQAGA